jgi:tetratricopeptide (TPR) repeat protein
MLPGLILMVCLCQSVGGFSQLLNVHSSLINPQDPIEKSKVKTSGNLFKDQRFDAGFFLYLNFFTDLNVVVLENPKSRIYKPEVSRKVLNYYLDNVAELNEAVIQDYFERGLARIDSSKFEEAMSDFDKCLVYDPENADAYLNRGVLFIYSKQFPEALEELDKAEKFDHENAGIFFNRGLVYYNLQLYPEAITQLDSCIRLDENYSRAYFEKGVVLSELGRNDEAIQNLRKARSLGDNDAQQFIEAIKNKPRQTISN